MIPRVFRSLLTLLLIVATVTPAYVRAQPAGHAVAAHAATIAAAQPSGAQPGDDLVIAGTPAPGIGFYYGGPPMQVISQPGDFAPHEQVVGTLPQGYAPAAYVATASSSGQVQAKWSLPLMAPGTYLLTVTGRTSGRAHFAHVTVAPVIRTKTAQGVRCGRLALRRGLPA